MKTRMERRIAWAVDFRKQVTHARLSRRELLQLAAAAGGSAFLGLRGNWVGAQSGDAISPPTRPFVDALRVPPVLPGIGAGSLQGGPPNPAEHPYYATSPSTGLDFPPREFYQMRVRAAQHRFHSDLDTSLIWGFEGRYPGPTFHGHYGVPILCRIHNDLPTDAELEASPTFGINQVITHLHNHHSNSFADGGPWDFYGPGHFLDHFYPMASTGFTTPEFFGTGDSRENQGTMFYHAHRPDFTAPNVYKGQVGFYLCFDELDTGSEQTGLRLPSGEFDVPLLYADKVFDPDGQLFFDDFNLDGIIGDKDTVNGVIQPFLRVKRRKYRLRILVGGPSRFANFYLARNGSFLNNPFQQIANDGNLLAAPVRRTNLFMAVAERFDVIVDFKALTPLAGGEIILVNRAEQTDGRQPTGRLLTPGRQVLKFIVEPGDVTDPSQVPATLRPQVPATRAESVRTRRWRFERGNGAWQINGQFFDPRRSRATVQRNTAEIWALENASNDWQHPIHIHLEEFHILSRNGERPPVYERGRKDVVRLGGNETIRIFMRFRDYPDPDFVHPDPAQQANVGRYPMHCHNMTHEDHAMMLRWDVVP